MPNTLIVDCVGSKSSIIKNSIRDIFTRPRDSQSKFYDKVPPTVATTNSTDETRENSHRQLEDNGVLPVKVAISKYEQLNNKQSNGSNSPPLQPPSLTHQTSIQRLFSPTGLLMSPNTSQTLPQPTQALTNTQQSIESASSNLTTIDQNGIQPIRYEIAIFLFIFLSCNLINLKKKKN